MCWSRPAYQHRAIHPCKEPARLRRTGEKAAVRKIAILRTPMGFGMAPMRDGKVVPPVEFNAWTDEEQREAVKPL